MSVGGDYYISDLLNDVYRLSSVMSYWRPGAWLANSIIYCIIFPWFRQNNSESTEKMIEKFRMKKNHILLLYCNNNYFHTAFSNRHSNYENANSQVIVVD